MLKFVRTRQEIIQIPIPEQTDSYSVVSHENIISEIEEMLDKRNLSITNELYRMDSSGNKLTGMLRINQGNSDMEFMIGFKNSYDKSISLGLAAGAQVIVCENGCVSGEIDMVRKHTGTILIELQFKIENIINRLENSFNLIVQDADTMKNITMSNRKFSELIGRMYVEEELFSPNQLSVIKDQFHNSEFQEFRGGNAWSLYNWCTYALKSSHSNTMLQDHVNLHNFFKKEIL